MPTVEETVEKRKQIEWLTRRFLGEEPFFSIRIWSAWVEMPENSGPEFADLLPGLRAALAVAALRGAESFYETEK